jgi:hypothetical protein
MIVARRDMTLNGHAVVAGQILDGIWPDLRELARRNLVRSRWVEEVQMPVASSAPAVPKKRGRKPKPVAQAST